MRGEDESFRGDIELTRDGSPPVRAVERSQRKPGPLAVIEEHLREEASPDELTRHGGSEPARLTHNSEHTAFPICVNDWG